MAAIEFIPPGTWKKVFFRRLGSKHGVGAFVSWSHWGFGFELGPQGFGSLLLGPLSIAFGGTRPVKSSGSAVSPAAPDPSDDVPVLNRLIEDYLAHGESEGDHAGMLSAWFRLGAEYMARAAGRKYAMDALEATWRFVRDAQPSKPWRS
jgi:hypothetical protein